MLRKLHSLVLAASLICAAASAQVIGGGVYGDTKPSGAPPTTYLKAVLPLYAYPNANPSNAATSYISLVPAGPGAGGNSNTEVVMQTVVATAGTISNLIAVQPTWATGSWVFTLWKNASATTLQTTINSTSVANDNTHSVSVSPGDRLSVQVCPGTVSGNTCTASGTPTQAAINMSVLWTSTVGQEGPLFSIPGTQANLIANDYLPFNAVIAQNATQVNVSAVMPTAGTIDNLYFNVRTTPGSGNTWTATVFHETAGNCGTGAATSLTATVVNGSTQASDTNGAHAFTVAQGDCLSVQITSSGSPTASIGSFSVRWQPTVAYEYPLVSVGTTISGTASATKFTIPGGTDVTTSTTTEGTAVQVILPNAGFSTMTASKWYYIQSTTAGGTSTRAWTLRGGAPPGTSQSSVSPTCTQATASATCASSNSSSMTGGNVIDYQYTNGTGVINAITWHKSGMVLTTQ